MSLIKLVFLLLAVIFLAACVATQAFPGIVRAGDTITLAVGSLDGLNRDNVTVFFYPDSDPGSPIDLTDNVRSVLKLFPDKTSSAYWDTSSGNGLNTVSYLSSLSGHGPWQSVVVVDLPVTLPEGTGIFRVIPGEGASFPLTLAKVQNVDIAIEVLASVGGDPAVGDAHSFEYRKLSYNNETSLGDLTKLEGLRQVVVSMAPDVSSGAVGVAAAEYSLTISVIDQFQNDVTSQLQSSDFAVVLDEQPSYSRNQTALMWSKSGNEFKVIITNTTGDQNYRLLRYSILLSNLEEQALNGWLITDTPVITHVEYFDLNGNQISGLITPNIVTTN